MPNVSVFSNNFARIKMQTIYNYYFILPKLLLHTSITFILPNFILIKRELSENIHGLIWYPWRVLGWQTLHDLLMTVEGKALASYFAGIFEKLNVLIRSSKKQIWLLLIQRPRYLDLYHIWNYPKKIFLLINLNNFIGCINVR